VHSIATIIVYLLFFLSGSAALMYQIIWVRSFSLIFGGSHLAVTTVLTVFMGGLALGSYLVGRYAQRYSSSPLRLYGWIELGIALSAVFCMLLIKTFPSIYIPLANFIPESAFYLTTIRILFVAFAIIIPTTLMGATLPLLSGFLARQKKIIGLHLSLLYAINTLGAVVGAAVAGFLLLPNISVSTTAMIAVSLNLLVGMACMQPYLFKKFDDENPPSSAPFQEKSSLTPNNASDNFVAKAILIGIGISGFCALGYEVLWSRVLSIVIGASTYGFTIILVSFLAGIGCGSLFYGFINKYSKQETNWKIARIGFGFIQIMIGIAALAVSVKLLDLPTTKSFVMKFLFSKDFSVFNARLFASIVVAFAYMFVPAFLMGIAFPMAGKIHALASSNTCRATGDVLSYNTIGAILGSALSGFLFIYAVGIERSLQIFIILNIGLGITMLASLSKNHLIRWGVLCMPAFMLCIVLFYPQSWKLWNQKWFAVYKANEMEGNVTPQMLRSILANTQVLYYGEGAQAIVSSVKTGDYQGFITNGRTESSNTPADLQCVYTLGHLPMLLAKSPKNIFVLGTGAGVTLGATSVHPGVEKITLVEIEPKVLGVAKTFDRYNHNVLENPKLKVVFNDGRNFLLTTKEKFDVITADPIHPWFSGAGYLYTDEYFKLAASRLNTGGVICQWVPIYELTEANLKSILATFRKNFKYTMLWLTQYDAELVGSNDPILLDEVELERRINAPLVKKDLTSVHMGSARDFLSFFIMGNRSAEAFSHGGIINTDQNLYLEFSAPLSMGKTELVAENIRNLTKHRENIIGYLKSPANRMDLALQQNYWQRNMQAAKLKDQAHIMYYTEGKEHSYPPLLLEIQRKIPNYATHKIMYDEYLSVMNLMKKEIK
jgi:spermidine synthase